MNAFFEPHVAAWLKDTESNTTQDWVSRAVGMDSVSCIFTDVWHCADSQWVPEGENKHSQSVIDLFEFIRGAAQVILHDLPLGEYRRAMYLIDLSKVRCSRIVSAVSLISDCLRRDVAVRLDCRCTLRCGYEPCQAGNSDRRDREQAREQAWRKGVVLARQGATSRQVDGEEKGRRFLYPASGKRCCTVRSSS